MISQRKYKSSNTWSTIKERWETKIKEKNMKLMHSFIRWRICGLVHDGPCTTTPS
jgi:hypothetical protein